MKKISFFSVCFLAVESVGILLCTTLGFYKSETMWVLSALLVVYSVIHISMYYLQKQDKMVKFKRFEKMRIGAAILLISWFFGVSYVASQSSPQRTFKEIVELWIERIKVI